MSRGPEGRRNRGTGLFVVAVALALVAATASDDDLRAPGKAGLDLLDEIRENVAPVVEGGNVADHVAPFGEVTPSLAEIHTERKRLVEAILAILEADGTIGPE